VVFGVGNEEADVLFVGEGPGEQEDLQGFPFVGPAGKLLDDMLMIIDLDRKTNCYIANIVKCRPPRNRDPLETEQDACIGYLRNQTALIRPRIIICLGRIAAKKLNISSAKVTIPSQKYTGRAITLDPSDIKIVLNKQELTTADFEIVSYTKNINKGTATVTLKGIGAYAGTKKASFKIVQKAMLSE
jgi:uracil-DNA glycosylase family 4